MAASILSTKLYIPPTRPTLVPRPRLIEQLNEGLRRKLTLISAPPGFGKTTLVSAWFQRKDEEARRGAKNGGLKIEDREMRIVYGDPRSSSLQLHPTRVAWVSLDEHDNDPVRFWSYVMTALESVQAGVGSNALTLLQAPQPPPIESTLTALINDLVTIPQHFALILDDYHVIKAEPIHQALIFLLDHLPAQMHLILISRTDPPLALTRFRVRDQLTELRANDLRFTPAEAATFLGQVMGLALSPVEVAALEARTEGWIAGLQLAALSMQGRQDVQGFVQAFTGSHRYVIDYLVEEVLAQQPRHVYDFLLKTSILDRLTSSLCDAVALPFETPGLSRQPETSTPEPGTTGQVMLEWLEQANLFIIPMDDERRWYRYHHLFADFLRADLQKTIGAAGITTLHRRASAWYAEHGFISEAINHALAAKDFGQAAGLIEPLVLPLLTHGEVMTLSGWLGLLPEALVRSHPRLSLGAAWATLINGDWNKVEPLIQAAESSLTKVESQSHQTESSQADAQTQGMWTEVAASRAMLLNYQGDAARAVELSLQALEQVSDDNLLMRSVLMMNLGMAYEASNYLDEASHALAEATVLAKASDNLITALAAQGNLANLHIGQGHLHQAFQLFEQSVQLVANWATERGQAGQLLPIVSRSYMGLVEILREWNDLETATHYLTLSLDLAQQEQIKETLQIGYILLAQILQAQGKPNDALKAIQQAEQLLQPSSQLAPWVYAVQARLWLAQGNLAAAAEWAQTAGLSLDEGFNYTQFPGEYTTLVRVLIAQEQFETALPLLERMHAIAAANGRTGRLLEILILQALALYAQGNPEQALTPFAQALTLAQPEGYVRLFVDEGEPIAALLRRAASRHLAPDYVRKLLSAFQKDDSQGEKYEKVLQPSAAAPLISSAQPLVEPLSERELEVLKLIATGMSNQDIAQHLVVAVSTIKSHTNKIFSKLDVQNRTQAVAKARELKLL